MCSHSRRSTDIGRVSTVSVSSPPPARSSPPRCRRRRLDEIVRRAQLDRFDRGRNAAVTGQYHDSRVRVGRLELRDEAQVRTRRGASDPRPRIPADPSRSRGARPRPCARRSRRSHGCAARGSSRRTARDRRRPAAGSRLRCPSVSSRSFFLARQKESPEWQRNLGYEPALRTIRTIVRCLPAGPGRRRQHEAHPGALARRLGREERAAQACQSGRRRPRDPGHRPRVAARSRPSARDCRHDAARRRRRC